MILVAEYVSNWEEGQVYTKCEFDTEDFSISNVETSGIGEDYEFYIGEWVEITVNGETYLLEAEHGELTGAGISDAKALFNHGKKT